MAFNKGEWKPNKKQELFLGLPTSIKEAVLGGGAGTGKAIDLNTIIPTTDGYKLMKDIHPGDFVYNHDGLSSIVLAESEIFTNHECYKVKFDNGVEVSCDADHKWVVHKNQTSRNKINKYFFLTTKELFESEDKWSIVVSEALHKTNYEFPIEPYTLGAWLGDGGSYDSKITSNDPEIIERIRNNYEVVGYEYNYSFRILNITTLLKKWDLIQNKHIPDIYFNLAFEFRLDLLQGLMDTDGTINEDGSGIEISLSDEKLAKDVIKLIHTLGIKTNWSINKSSFNGKNYKDRYRIRFVTDLPVFGLKRKADRLNNKNFNTTNNITRTKWHYIQSIEKIDPIPVKCIQVYGGIYLITEACIPTHNSDTLLVYPLVHKWHENPRFKQVFQRRTFPELRNEIVPRSREIYLKFGATFNKSDMAWTFPRNDQYGSGAKNNGAVIFLAHCEDESDVSKFDSMEINLYTPDELTSYTEYIYLYIGFTRVRTSDPTLPAIIRGAAMCGGIGHTFVKNRFVQPYRDAGLDPYSFPPKVIVGRGGNKRVYVHSTLVDNPHIDQNYAQSLEALPDAERNAKKYGDWDAYLGSVFQEFRDKHYPDEPENALHVIEPFEIPSWWPKIVVGDWGFRAMTWIGFAAISPQGRVYVYRELTWKQTKIEEWAPFVKDYIDKENPRIIKFCKSAGQDRGQEHTIQQQISTALGKNVGLTTNSPGSRVSGKILLHEYLRWKPKKVIFNKDEVFSEEYAMWIWRNRGENEYKSYINSFNPPTEEVNLPKLQIFKDCPILIQAIKTCTYAKPRNNKPAEDVAEFDGDDPYDGIRYIVDASDKFFEEAAEEFIKIQETQMIVDKLNTTGDMTSFYRNMSRLESGEKVEVVGRYSH